VKTIAVDLDDTLNDFEATLQQAEFPHEESYGLPAEVFARYLPRVRSGSVDDGDLTTTEYSTFRVRLHERCYRLAKANQGGVEFMRWLRLNHWRIVICTQRDLRRVKDDTKKWLDDQGIPFDYLFMAGNKIVFCNIWGITHLVDDHAFNIVHGKRYNVNVYYPIMEKHRGLDPQGARGFTRFDEVKEWIERDPGDRVLTATDKTPLQAAETALVSSRIDLLKEFYRGLPKDRVKVEIHRHGFPFLESLLSDGASLEYGELTLSELLHKYKLSQVSHRRMDDLLRLHVEKGCNVCLYFDDQASSLFCLNLDNNHKTDNTVLIPEMELAVRVLRELMEKLGCEPLIIASGRGYHVWGRLERAVDNGRLHDFMMRLLVRTMMALHENGHDYHKVKSSIYPDKRIRDTASLRLFGSNHVKTKRFSAVLGRDGLLDEPGSWEYFKAYLETKTFLTGEFEKAYAAAMAQPPAAAKYMIPVSPE